MTPRAVLAMGMMLIGSAASALDCELVNLEDRVDQIMRALAKPTAIYQNTTALGIGELSKPGNPICEDTDWTGNTTCSATQTFSGTLYSVHGIVDVKETPIQSLFYEYGLDPDAEMPASLWHPWTKEPMLIAFHQPIDGPLGLTHVDACANGLMVSATPELHTALALCHAKGRCPGRARRILKSFNQAVF